MTVVLVYGTLKQGFMNAPVMECEQFLGRAVTCAPRFKLYETKKYRYLFPAVIEVAENGYKIYGELYEISNRCLGHLDYMEGVAHGLYVKKTIAVKSVDGRVFDDVNLYVFNQPLEGAEHVGPCWPISELNRFKFADRKLRFKEQDVVVPAYRLWNRKNEQWDSPAFELESDLKQWVVKRSSALGGDEKALWSPTYFEQRFDEVERKQRSFWIVSAEAETILSPEFSDLDAMAEWATTAATYFGGEKDDKDGWLELLRSMMPKVDTEL